jgi:hypothetical protein
MIQTFNINAKEMVILANNLEKLHRSAMPITVRGTLNDLAFDARKGIIRNFKEEFIIRNRTFIISHTTAIKCQNTFDIDKMQSEAGVLAGKTKAGDLLKIQEEGGAIERDKIPSENVRAGSNWRKPVLQVLYAKKFMNRPNGKIYKSAESSIFKSPKGIFRILRGGIWKRLYTLDKTVSIRKTPFVEPAGETAALKAPQFFEKNAQRQFKKYFK